MSLTDYQGYSWIISLSALLSVFIGWRVVYRNAKKIATRTESKAITDHLIKLSNEIIDLSVNFWMGVNNDNKADALRFSLAVSAKVTQIDDFVSILSKREIKIDRDYLANFASSTTIDAELKSNLSEDDRAEKCQECVDVGMRFITHTYTCFEERHPPQKITKKIYHPYYLEHFDSYCYECQRPYIAHEFQGISISSKNHSCSSLELTRL